MARGRKKKSEESGNGEEFVATAAAENETEEENLAREFADKMAKKHGRHVVMSQMTSQISSSDVVSTWIPSLDYVLVIGGLHRGSLYEIYGDPDAGKSSLLYHISGSFQKQGLRVAFVNAEKTYNEEYARVYGMNSKAANIFLPDNTEASFEIINDCLDENFDLICVDSASGMVPMEVRTGKRGKDNMYAAYCAQIFSRHLHSTVAKISENKSIVLMTNHTYDPIGDPNAKYKEKPTKAGKELTFLSDVRLEIRQHRNLKSKNTGEVIGNEVSYKCWRNKWGFRLRVSPRVLLHWHRGMMTDLDVVRLAMFLDIIESRGAWYECKDVGLRIQGKVALQELYKDTAVVEKLKPLIYQAIQERRTMSEEAAEIDLEDAKKKDEDGD